ncbi:MAG: cobalamin-dependent protein [Candidatus Marinimicrobia bacterium]|nr:cobalamin-dependent protein [Candidatus Neomarinimicrobiota bacterium]
MNYDIILVHAPSVYDFRHRDDVLFAYLSNSDSVHVSSIFEMPPVGILSIKQHLQRCSFNVEFFNVASKMLRDPDFDVEKFFEKVPSNYIGVDLHWLAHSHGALELLKLYKDIHPSSKTIVGGISSTYFHEELIDYPQVDYVIRGYDTLLPIELLLNSNDLDENLIDVPNLTWKQRGQVIVNEMSHIPPSYSAAVDWRQIFTGDRQSITPYNIVIPQSGCEYNCKWCGGSSYFYKKYMASNKRVRKTPEILRSELQSITGKSKASHTVTMIDFWHENSDLFNIATDIFRDENIDCVHYMFNRLPTVEKCKSISMPAKAIIELSPDSHDQEIAKASGRGKYTMEEMEDFIDSLIDDVYSFEIYFMIGLPKQTIASIWETVNYCEHLLKKYRGKGVTPYICPMLPFLDPGSEIYDNPEKFGYKIFHHTLRDHYDALLSMNWKHRLNYETKWLSREELVDISYESVRALTLLKHKYKMLPEGIANSIVALIDSTRVLLKEIDAYQEMSDEKLQEEAGFDLKKRILEYNKKQFNMVRSQQRPVDLGFAKQQWFDTDEAFEKVLGEVGNDDA